MGAFRMPESSREEMRRGIAYIVLSIFLFAGVNALAKWTASIYPVTEVLFFRCIFSLLPAVLIVAGNGGLGSLHTRHFPLHAGRAVVQFCSMMLIFTAFQMMPLADAVAITFSTPLFLTVLSIPLLGEKVGVHRWSAVLIGFAGVLLMVRPGEGSLELPALLALTHALLSALVTIWLRRMSVTESSSAITFYQLAVTAGLSVVLVPFGWITPTWTDGALMAAMGLLAGTGQFLWAQAFRYAPAAVAAPFTYTAIIWATLIGFVVWGDIPTLAVVAGATIVAASGLYILYRETLRRVAPAVAVEPAACRDAQAD